jgi:hypothetical protein
VADWLEAGMTMFQSGDELPEKIGTALGAAFMAVVYFGVAFMMARATGLI